MKRLLSLLFGALLCLNVSAQMSDKTTSWPNGGISVVEPTISAKVNYSYTITIPHDCNSLSITVNPGQKNNAITFEPASLGNPTPVNNTYTWNQAFHQDDVVKVNFASFNGNNNQGSKLSSVTCSWPEYKTSVGSVGYSTIYLPFNAAIPAGVTVMNPSSYNQEKNYIHFDDFAEGVIAATNGFVLKAEPATYVFEYSLDEGISNSILSGTCETVTNPNDGTIYTLSNKNGIGFYRYTGANLGAYKAYLQVSGSSNAAARIGFEEEETSIRNVADEVQNSENYTIQGLKVNSTAKPGMYIVNGKKVIIK